MDTMKTNERLAAVRNEARAELPALDGATKVGTGTYIMATENGFAKVTISAMKETELDLADLADAYASELEAKADKAAEKVAARDAKAAEKAAKKAAK